MRGYSIHASRCSSTRTATPPQIGKRSATIEEFSNVRVFYAPNMHKIRGYNRLAKLARGSWLLFTQEDRLPPGKVQWIDALLSVLSLLPSRVAAAGNVC